MKIRLRLLAFAAAPLLYLPLRAAEAPPPSEPEATEESDTPASPPAESTPAPPARRERAPANEAPPPEGGERLSLDNNISFPVDI